MTKTVQVYSVYIKATPEAIWEAITKPEWTVKYGYAPLVEYDLRPGGAFRMHPNEGMKAFPEVPAIIGDGEVIEADPPRKLVQTWRMLMTPELAAEGFTRLTYDIQSVKGDVTKLTVTHDLTNAPKLAALNAGEHEGQGAGGGWPEILSGLKTLLETGQPLPFQSGR
ncbi:MAG TPA: SRPBCC family protein [Chloroflexota bacterium]